MSVLINIPLELDNAPSWFQNYISSMESALDELETDHKLNEIELRKFFIDKWKEYDADIILGLDDDGHEELTGIKFASEQKLTHFILKWG